MISARLGLIAFAVALSCATELRAQWSDYVPGVPGAWPPGMSSVQKRWEIDLSGYWMPVDAERTNGARLRTGGGWSWRVATGVEFGFDFTLVEVAWLNPADASADPTRLTIAGVYGARFGLKFTPISSVDLDGNGFALAIGGGFQPNVAPLITHQSVGDSTVTGGVIGDAKDGDGIGKIHAAALFTATATYRSGRLMLGSAAVIETGDRNGSSAIRVPAPVSARVGLVYRLTHGLSLAASFWGNGAPPWRDRLALSAPIEEHMQFGVWLTSGGAPEGGLFLTGMSPTGAFGESASLYLASR